MKIATIDAKEVDTDKLPDVKAQLIELIENSGIRKFVMDHDGACFVTAFGRELGGWSTCHADSPEKFNGILHTFNNFVLKVTKNKMRLAVVPNEESKNE